MVDDEIVSVQLGPTGPVQIGRMWFEAVLGERTLGKAWLVMRREFRQLLAQAWVDANADHPTLASRGLPELVENLSALRPDDPLWPNFAETTLGEFDEKWPDVEIDTWGYASAPRVVGPNREVVFLVNTDDPNLIDKGDRYEVAGGGDEEVPIRAQGLILELCEPGDTEGVQIIAGETENFWRVADFDRGDADARAY